MKKIVIMAIFMLIILCGCNNFRSNNIKNNSTKLISNENSQQTPDIAEKYPKHENELSSQPSEQTQIEDPSQMSNIKYTKQYIEDELKNTNGVHDKVWSINGNSVVYVLDKNIYLRKVGEEKGKLIETNYLGNMIWSKDNSKIVFIRKYDKNTLISVYNIVLGKSIDLLKSTDANMVYYINSWNEVNKLNYTITYKNTGKEIKKVLHIKDI